MSINSKSFKQFDASRVPSPCFVVDEVAVENNLKILQRVQQESGAKILLALKAFSMFSLSSLIQKYLKGCCASGLNEAILAYEKFGGDQEGENKREVHVFSPAFNDQEMEQLLPISDHFVFNSFSQWNRFKNKIGEARSKRPNIQCGIRINPMLSQGTTELYDPCSPGSRLGVNAEIFRRHIKNVSDLEGISGLHFHTLCEQGFVPLAKTLKAVEEQFEDYLPHMEWLNFGGGHHITHPDYDVDGLITRIRAIQEKYNLQVYLEPGEAIAIHSGVLVSEVRDLTENKMDIAIVDTSATCHMPDTMEMPYRAEIFTHFDKKVSIAGLKGDKPHRYRIGGQTCLAGDVMGDYSFDQPLQVGQRLMFDDMAHYTMVKTTTFNGIGLPAIAVWNSQTDELKIIKEFGYQDFAKRLS